MNRSLTLSLATLLLTAAPAFAGGMGCDVTLDQKTYTQRGDGIVLLTVELKRADLDCAPSGFLESDPQHMGPVMHLERKDAKGKWSAVKDGWQVPKTWGPTKPVGTPYRLDWGCSLKIPRKAKLPPGIYRVRVSIARDSLKGHRFEFTSKAFTVFAPCKKTTKS